MGRGDEKGMGWEVQISDGEMGCRQEWDTGVGMVRLCLATSHFHAALPQQRGTCQLLSCANTDSAGLKITKKESGIACDCGTTNRLSCVCLSVSPGYQVRYIL